MPELFRTFGKQWGEVEPDWRIEEWTEENLPVLENQDLYDRASEICPGFEGQLRSDIARLEILAAHGGVYLDCDFEPLRPIDELLVGVQCFAAWEISGQVVNNAILGATPAHPFILELLRRLRGSVENGIGRRPSQISGPRFVTEVYRTWTYPEVRIFPQRLFYPYACNELRRAGESFPDAYAVHHWNNQRRLRRIPLEPRRTK
jgi:mannosyltransferase OCH1-like enzyme